MQLENEVETSLQLPGLCLTPGLPGCRMNWRLRRCGRKDLDGAVTRIIDLAAACNPHCHTIGISMVTEMGLPAWGPTAGVNDEMWTVCASLILPLILSQGEGGEPGETPGTPLCGSPTFLPAGT